MQSLQVLIDPRLELLSVIQFFSDYGEKYRPLTDFDSDYRQAVVAYFSDFKEHGAVTLFGQLVQAGFNFSYPVDFAFSLTFDLQSNSLLMQEPVAKSTAERVGGAEQIEQFAREMADFAKQSDFGLFYKENRETYRAMIDEVQTKLAPFDILGAFAAYFGVDYGSYSLVLNVLCDAGGYGIWRQTARGLEAFTVGGPIEVEAGLPRFVREPQGMCAFLWHEFAHSVINPLTSGRLAEVEKFADLFEPVAEQMKAQAYGKWEFCLNEHIVRASVIRLLKRQFGPERGRELLDYDKSIGFYLLDPLLEWLKVYEENRDQYKNFAQYYPGLFHVLASVPGMRR